MEYFGLDGEPIKDIDKYLQKLGMTPNDRILFKLSFELFSSWDPIELSSLPEQLQFCVKKGTNPAEQLPLFTATFFCTCCQCDVVPPVAVLNWISNGFLELFKGYEEKTNEKDMCSLENILGISFSEMKQESQLLKTLERASKVQQEMQKSGKKKKPASENVGGDLGCAKTYERSYDEVSPKEIDKC